MTTAVFVTPALDPDSPVRGFASTHIRALASKFDRVVVVAGSAHGDLGATRTEIVTANGSPDHGALRIGPPLATVLAEVGADALVVVEDDLACLVQARSVICDRRIPLLWWCPHAPTAHAASQAAKWADGLLVATPADLPVLECPVFTVGAGIDLGPPAGPSSFPDRPPLRLIAVGRTSPSKGLPVIVRAVAIVRSRGLDARLFVVGPSTNVTEWQHRRELESLVKGLALTQAVRIGGALTPCSAAEMVRRAHVFIDAGVRDGMSRALLEAMAAGRIVLSASPTIAPMLERASPIPLTFAAGDSTQLAERIAGLQAAWQTGLPSITRGLRLEVEKSHSAEHWVEQVIAAACTTTRSQP